MLRSIFSLIQNIIDSDKEYSNKKSKTVIYLVSTPENNLNMDLEIDGQQRENIKSLREDEFENEKVISAESAFKIGTEQGDSVDYKHVTDKGIKARTKKEDEKLIEEYKEAVEKYNERVTFTNDDEILGKEETVVDAQKIIDSNEVNVHDLWEKLPSRQIKPFQKEKDQIAALMEQIQKMKMGMERLQEIAQQFNCSKQFKQDVEFLTKNVGPALEKSEVEDQHLTQKM